jgi:drug/metabolite transporter (DMT)-like permease
VGKALSSRAEGRSLECGDERMKSTTVLGILLAVLGVLALVYQGFSYTRQEKVFDVGPIHATRDDTQRIPLPPIVGGLALLGGAALLVIGARQRA